MISFNDTALAFKSKSDRELYKAKKMLMLISNPVLIRVGTSMLSIATFLHIPFGWAVKFIYKHFVGGKTLDDCLPVTQKLSESKIHVIPDYSVEGEENEHTFDAVCHEVIQVLTWSKINAMDIPFAVFKPSGIARFNLLEKVSAHIELNEHEQNEWIRVLDRFESIATAAHEADIPVLVDAEESWIQNAIDDIIESLSAKYNKNKAIVFNTYQMYRTDRLTKLKASIEKAKNEHYFLGIKFVRGAYWEKENHYAVVNTLPSAVFQSKPETDESFNNALILSLQNHLVVSVVNATHNEESSMLMIDLMSQNNIDKDNPRFWFAQLYGMSDHISYNLAIAGYKVAKYLPYGPIKLVMPYLIRRAKENTSVKGQTGRELLLINKEITRRKANHKK